MKKKLSESLHVFLFIILSLVFTFSLSSCRDMAKKDPITQEELPQEPEIQYSYVHFIDAQQGDCTLIETHDGKFALIDASTQGASEYITNYLRDQNVTELEYVIFTHPHEDHIGGGDEIIREFKVNTVYMTSKTENTACYQNLLSAIAESKTQNGTTVLRAIEGDKFYLSDIEFIILSDGSDYEDTNNSSICVTAELGDTTFLFTGDAEKIVEYDILEKDFDIEAEIYKCAHHGSSTSNSRRFLDEVNPLIAIVSCGVDNPYGHPHVEVIEDFIEREVPVFRTDEDGDIVIAFNHDHFLMPSR